MSFRSVFASSRRSTRSRANARCSFMARPTPGTHTTSALTNKPRSGHARAIRPMRPPSLMAWKMRAIHRW